jgi:uncharacterized protein (TIGR00725 family)
MARLPIVGVMGSGSEAYEPRAQQVGSWLATEGVHLLTGGGGGVMAAVSRAFHETPGRRGLVIGVLPSAKSASSEPKPGYPNPWVEIPIFTHLPLSGERGTDPMSRNHINVLSADVLIFLPGAAGTAGEAELAVSYQTPAIAYLVSRSEIPDLAADVADTSSFEDVQRIVRTELNRVARSLGP